MTRLVHNHTDAYTTLDTRCRLVKCIHKLPHIKCNECWDISLNSNTIPSMSMRMFRMVEVYLTFTEVSLRSVCFHNAFIIQHQFSVSKITTFGILYECRECSEQRPDMKWKIEMVIYQDQSKPQQYFNMFHIV